MRKINTDLDDLMVVFESSGLECEYWLDLESGELVYVSELLMDSDELDAIYERIDSDRERYLKISSESSKTGYQDMVDFVNTVEDEALKEKLKIALDGKGAFRRFKNVLGQYPEQRKRWFEFKEAQLKKRVLKWLEENELELEVKNNRGDKGISK